MKMRKFLVVKVAMAVIAGLIFPIVVATPSHSVGPGDIDTGLLLWLDASDPDNDGDNTNNPANGTSVTSWSDRSGNGNNARILSGQGSPTYRPSSNINSVPAMRFVRSAGNSGQVFEVPGVDIRATTRPDVTIFAVYRASNPVSGQLFGVWGQDNGSWDRFFISNGYNGTTNGVVGLGPTQGGFQVNGAGDGTTRLVTVLYDGNVSGSTNSGPTNGSKIYFDGAEVNQFTDSTHPTNAQSTFRIGWDGDDSAFNGDIAEIIIYDRVLSDTDVNTVSTYLADKYGVSLAPTVTTNAATSITRTTATLNALVNAHSETTTALTLRYATTSAGVASGASPTVTPTSVSGNSDVSVSAVITGLTANTTYFFRVAATNIKGSDTGDILSFTTSAEDVVSSCAGAGAILNGSFENGSTDWRTTALDGGFEIWTGMSQNRSSTAQITNPSNGYTYDGANIAEIAANTQGDGPNSRQGLYQDVATIANARVFWSYWHKHRANTASSPWTNDQVSRFRAGPSPDNGVRPASSTWTQAEQEDPFNGVATAVSVDHSATLNSAWTQSSGTFSPTTSRTRFLFNNQTSPAAGYGNLIDDVRFTTYSACPMTVRIVAGRASSFQIRNIEQDTSATKILGSTFRYYGPAGAQLDTVSAVSTGLTVSLSNVANTSSAFALSASSVGTYSLNYRVAYTFSGTTYTSTSTLTVEVVPEVTARFPSEVPFDPTITVKSLPGIRFNSATNAYVCFDQVANRSAASISPTTVSVGQSGLTSGAFLVSSGPPLIDSGTVGALTNQSRLVRITSNSGVLGRGGSKFLRVRASSIDNTDGVAPSCANGISFVIEFKTIKMTQTRRYVVPLKNGRQQS